MDAELLFSFLEVTQPDALARLEKLYGNKTRQTILKMCIRDRAQGIQATKGFGSSDESDKRVES